MSLEVNHGALRDIDARLLQCVEMTADQLLTNLINSQKMPFDTGMMQNIDTFLDTSELQSKKEVDIVTTSPQARRLYYHPEYNFNQSHNSDAGGLWWDEYIDGSKKELANTIFTELAKRRLKPYDN